MVIAGPIEDHTQNMTRFLINPAGAFRAASGARQDIRDVLGKRPVGALHDMLVPSRAQQD